MAEHGSQQETTTDGRRPRPGLTREPVAANDLFEVLSKPQNRYILYYLIRVGRAVTTNELIEYAVGTVGRDGDQTEGELRGEIRGVVERVLPGLDELGLVAYDEASGLVEPTPTTFVAEPHLALAMELLE
jgi:hypothetical protein